MSTASTDFSGVKLRPFASPGFGLVLYAPDTWKESGDPAVFQVSDPQTGTQISASAYENPGAPLDQWAGYRLQVVQDSMPYLRPVGGPRELSTRIGTAIAAAYEGTFPGRQAASRYLVLCLRTDTLVLSVTVTAPIDAYAEHEDLYLWLLQTQMNLHTVERVSAP